jgi:hypothetical protein
LRLNAPLMPSENHHAKTEQHNAIRVHTGNLSTLQRINGLRQSSQIARSIALHLQPEAVLALEQAAALPREAATTEAVFPIMQTEHYVVAKHEASVVVRESPGADAAEVGTLLP